jgi:hypothetical protein
VRPHHGGPLFTTHSSAETQGVPVTPSCLLMLLRQSEASDTRAGGDERLIYELPMHDGFVPGGVLGTTHLRVKLVDEVNDRVGDPLHELLVGRVVELGHRPQHVGHVLRVAELQRRLCAREQVGQLVVGRPAHAP